MAFSPPVPVLPPIYVGQELTFAFTTTYKNENTDGAMVQFIVTPPGQSPVTYTYGSSSAVTKIDVGIYYLTVTANLPGLWTVEGISSGKPTTTAKAFVNVLT